MILDGTIHVEGLLRPMVAFSDAHLDAYPLESKTTELIAL